MLLGLLGEVMSDLLLAGLFSGIFDFIGGINFEVIFQLISLALIVIAGPVVVAFLAFQGGDM
jgi:hypothetical protein